MIVYMYYGLLPEIKLSYLILSYLILKPEDLYIIIKVNFFCSDNIAICGFDVHQ